MDNDIRKFKFKYCLRNIKTRDLTPVKETIIEGTYGEQALAKFQMDLRKEGIYELEYPYSYFEILPKEENN